MKLAALLVGVVTILAGCEDRYGTYIRVRAPADLAYDALDFYFGKSAGDTVPITPVNLAPIREEQLLVTRSLADADHQEFAAPTREFTLYIPERGDNVDLGRYLLVIGSQGGMETAHGELFSFDVTDTGEVRIYTVDLTPLDTRALSRWGRGPAQNDCLQLSLTRDNNIAAVAIARDGDVDCDSFTDDDCAPLRYCDGQGGADCMGASLCSPDPASCSLGRCINRDTATQACEPALCLSDTLCSACDLSKPPAEALQCALLASSTHPPEDLPVPVQGSRRLCTDPEPEKIDIMLPFPCTAPAIEAVAYLDDSGDMFSFTIATDPVEPNVCTLHIDGLPDARFRGTPHLLVTLADAANNQRFGFVMGLEAQEGCPPPGSPIRRSYVPLTGTCAQ